MKFRFFLTLSLLVACTAVMGAKKKKQVELFPDGTPIPAWFSDTTKVDVDKLGKKYVITDYGVRYDPTLVQTEKIQAVIDRAAAEGGGVIVIPEGVLQRGALFFN